ncbi:MAG: hypothetical protein Ct9H300mP12_12870 [Acidimicrobiales bacterium]|nr:MAG: hypothetical protein Ct9H300mP12_12870 [Acidimicrobiales bacterium]
MTPPFFPICYRELAGRVSLHETNEGSFDVGPAQVTALSVPHIGRTFGYRVEWNGCSVAYVSDHLAAERRSDPRVDERVLALANGVDLLIHDAQFTAEEFAERPHWGHCTVDYALEVAHQAWLANWCFSTTPRAPDERGGRDAGRARESPRYLTSTGSRRLPRARRSRCSPRTTCWRWRPPLGSTFDPAHQRRTTTEEGARWLMIEVPATWPRRPSARSTVTPTEGVRPLSHRRDPGYSHGR